MLMIYLENWGQHSQGALYVNLYFKTEKLEMLIEFASWFALVFGTLVEKWTEFNQLSFVVVVFFPRSMEGMGRPQFSDLFHRTASSTTCGWSGWNILMCFFYISF